MARGNGLMMLGVGAALMYLLDPQAGRKRRNDLRNQIESTKRKVQRGTDAVVRDATNRTHGMLVRTQQGIRALRERVEARGNGAANAPAEGASALRSAVAPWQKTRWSPAQRALAGALGAGLTTSGYVRGGLGGLAMTLAGAGLVVRAMANEELAAMVKGKPIGVDKTIRIEAPPEQVYAYWRNLENFPQWMSHVREVRYLGGDRFHWIVDGPAGAPVEWDSELLDVRENREMTWRSVEGSSVEHAGRVRFEPEGDATRVHVQLRYAPPGGAIGHAVAKAFGVDPRSEMDDDLMNLKSLVETGQLPRNTAMERRLDLGGAGANP